LDPVPDPLLLINSGSARNRAQAFGFVARNSDHWTTLVRIPGDKSRGLGSIPFERAIEIYVRFSGSAGGQMGRQDHRTSRKIYIFLRKVE
jgi:hypothetical protein